MAESKEAASRITRTELRDAILRHFPPPEAKGANLDEPALLAILTRLDLAAPDRSLVELIQAERPDCSLRPEHHASIAFLDHCLAAVMPLVTRDPARRALLLNAGVALVRTALLEGLAAACRGHPVLAIMDQLLGCSLGISQLAARQRDLLEAELLETINQLGLITSSRIDDPVRRKSRDGLLQQISGRLQELLDREQARISRLEERLVASEIGALKAARARNQVAAMLNEKMAGVPLPADLIRFCQGPWYDSLQLLLARHGAEAEVWARARQLTDTLIWTVGDHLGQPANLADPQGAKDARDAGFNAMPAPTPVCPSSPDEAAGDAAPSVEFDETSGAEASRPARPLSELSLSLMPLQNEPATPSVTGGGPVASRPSGSPDFAKLALEPLPGQASVTAAPARTEERGQTPKPSAAAAVAHPASDNRGTSPLPATVPDSASIEMQKFYRIIERLPEELQELLVSLRYDAEATASALADIEQLHVAIATRQPLQRMLAEPLPVESALPIGAAVSRNLIAEVQQLKPGQWFCMETRNNQIEHLKLALKLDDLQQLLFTNRVGIKVMQKDFAEFAYLLSSGAVTPVPTQHLLSSRVRTELNRIVGAYLQQRADARESARIAKAHEAERVARLAERAARQVRERQAAVEAAARAAAPAPAPAAAPAPAEAPTPATTPQHHHRATELRVGAWVSLRTASGKRESAKLAVHLPAVDRYIFVDRGGLKVCEWNQAQLAEQLANGDCSILDPGSGFEDTLAKVVSGLRENRFLDSSDE